MKAIVEAAGLKVADIVKTTVFVKDLNDFSIVNATYEAFFTEHSAPFPARSCVEVARLPKDVKNRNRSHRRTSLILPITAYGGLSPAACGDFISLRSVSLFPFHDRISVDGF